MEVKNSFAKGFLEGFKNFGLYFANVVNFILMFIVYFTAVALTSIAAKLKRKEFLDLGKGDKETFWIKREPETKSIEKLKRSF